MLLVTGGAGFIGSHVCFELLKEGYDVVIFDSLELGHIESVNILKNLKLKGRVIDFIKGDLKNTEDVKVPFDKYKFDGVLHLAAYSQVGEAEINPEKYYINNVVGSLNLFSEMIKNKIDKLIFSSTAATYGEPDYTPVDEQHQQNPINTYGRTKFMVEQILEDYSKTYNLRSIRLRYFNVVGVNKDNLLGELHDPETHLVPNILKSALGTSKVFELYGDDYDTPDGTCVRDYVDVEDLAKGHVLSLKYLENGGGTDFFNLGTGKGNSVKEIFSLCEEVSQKKIDIEVKSRRPNDPERLVADYKKAEKILGWMPENSLKYSISNAYEWQKILKDKK